MISKKNQNQMKMKSPMAENRHSPQYLVVKLYAVDHTSYKLSHNST